MSGYTHWHVGMKVVCVDASSTSGYRWHGDAPTVGEVYTIVEIFVSPIGVLCLELAELKRNEEALALYGWNRIGYGARRFRPVQERKTDISIFERLLTDPHVRIEEDA